MRQPDIFHEAFKERPYWWEAYAPEAPELADVPATSEVAVIGAGYAGLATALELAKLGLEATVVDAAEPGYGASTRSGGLIGGSHSIKKPLVAKAPTAERAAEMMSDAADGFYLLEKLIEEENIECGFHRTGRFTGAISTKHYRAQEKQCIAMNESSDAGAYMVPRERVREEIGSDYYRGGLVATEAAHLHPALYYAGLKRAAEARGVRICAKAGVTALDQDASGWTLKTERGTITARDVVVATNGYTGSLTPGFKRRLVPISAYIIATEELPADLLASISPKNRSFVETLRIVPFFRLSPDGTRLIFGSRVKWRDLSAAEMAPLIFERALERFPELADYKITHAWNGNVALTIDEQPHLGKLEGLHYALGCNGSGVAQMTYMGTQLARKIAQVANYRCAFDTGAFPTHPLYTGNKTLLVPMVGNYLRFRDWWDRRSG
ncbi:MAG: FAD-dependent oxidoreductase [Pseudomonadota bacterium]